MANDFNDLCDSGISYPLATEIGRQLAAGIGDPNKLGAVGLNAGPAIELASQINAGTFSDDKLARAMWNPSTAVILAALGRAGGLSNDPAPISWGAATLIGFQTGTVAASSPAAVMRKTFTPAKTVKSAVLQATALGTYIPYINGQRVDTRELTPGWTDYNLRRQFQTYNVTSLITTGLNAVGVEVGDGWAHGNMSTLGRNYYGADVPRAMVALQLTYTDGTTDLFVSDTTWKATVSDNTKNDLYNGSTHDNRLKIDWSNPATSDSAWSAVTSVSNGAVPLVKQISPPARRKAAFNPIARTNPSGSIYIFDLGQNHAGYITFTVTGATAGQTFVFRHGEDLNNDGTLYVANLRTATATDTFIAAGTGTEVFEPRHTCHGFRYVELTGYTGVPPLNCIVSHAIYQDAAQVSTFTTNSPILQQTWNAADWAWRSNSMTVPSDCPQRDERMGWTDAHHFANAATYLHDVAAFLNKHCDDLDDTVASDGTGKAGDTAPLISTAGKGRAGWGDSTIFTPWTLYQAYGDTAYLTRHWTAMKAVLGALPYPDFYGDYLNTSDSTNTAVLSSAWAYRAASIMNQAATVLGDSATAASAATAMATFSTSFNTNVSNGGATIGNNSQCSYIVALAFGLLPVGQRAAAFNALVASINANGPTYGFTGMQFIYDVMSDNGRPDLAYYLAEAAWNPSLGYQLSATGGNGTTLAEQWDPHGTRGVNDSVNSYNHFTRGSVLSWIAKDVAGINALTPGFATVLLRPRPGGALMNAGATASASMTYASRAGTISTNWSIATAGATSTMTWTFTTPTPANVVLPAGYTLASGSLGTQIADDAITGGHTYQVPGGSYSITATAPYTASAAWTPLNLGSALVAWWDPTSGISLNSGNIASWTDRSSNTFVASQGTAGNQPGFNATGLNGFPAYIGASGKYLSATSMTADQMPFTAFAVTNFTAGTGAILGASTTAGGLEFRTEVGGTYSILNQANNNIGTSTNASVAGTVAVALGNYNQTAYNFRVNGLPAGSGFKGFAWSGVESTTIGSNAGASEYYTGALGDVVKMNIVAGLLQAQKLEGWGAWKYGSASVLTSGHPYRGRAPLVSDPG